MVPTLPLFIKFKNLTSYNLFQIWLLTPFPNGLLHDCPTKSLKQTCPISPIRNLTFWVSLIEYIEYKNYVNSERSLSDCIRLEIHSKVTFTITLGSTFHNLGTFWVLTNWRHCRGTKAQIFPGYKRHILRFDCWWWTTVRYQQGCAYFTWRLHIWRI